MPITFLNNPSLVSPMFSSGIDQQYTIMLATKIGCITVDTLMVKVAKKADIYVPTAFTPNSDGLNDLLHPVLMGIKEFRFFRVYNRWGQLLFQTNRSNTGWDGRLNGTHQPTGVVVWVAEGVGADNKVYTRKGTTVLMR
jgi:gliding motility-associated-like protein